MSYRHGVQVGRAYVLSTRDHWPWSNWTHSTVSRRAVITPAVTTAPEPMSDFFLWQYCIFKHFLSSVHNLLAVIQNEHRSRTRFLGHGPLSVREMRPVRSDAVVLERVADLVRFHRRWLKIQVNYVEKRYLSIYG